MLKHPKQKWFAASTIKVLHFILGIPKLFAVHGRIKSGCIIDPKTNPHPNRIQLGIEREGSRRCAAFLIE